VRIALVMILSVLVFPACKPPKVKVDETKTVQESSDAKTAASSLNSSSLDAATEPGEINPETLQTTITSRVVDTELIQACTFTPSNPLNQVKEQAERLLDQNAGVEHLLSGLAKARAANDGRPIFMDIYWLGCSGCRELLGRDKESIAKIEALTHPMKVSWRTGGRREEPRNPVTAAYEIFTHMVSKKVQVLDYQDPHGVTHQNRLIEDYMGHDRVHFPQLLFIDPQAVQRAPLMSLCKAQKERKLFMIHPQTLEPAFFSSAFTNELGQQATIPNRDIARMLLADNAIYSQLLNENIFLTNNFDLNEAIIEKSVAAVMDTHRKRMAGVHQQTVGVWSARRQTPEHVVAVTPTNQAPAVAVQPTITVQSSIPAIHVHPAPQHLGQILPAPTQYVPVVNPATIVRPVEQRPGLFRNRILRRFR